MGLSRMLLLLILGRLKQSATGLCRNEKNHFCTVADQFCGFDDQLSTVDQCIGAAMHGDSDAGEDDAGSGKRNLGRVRVTVFIVHPC